MLINFNVEKLDKLLYDLYLITGLTVSVWDSQMNQLSFQPKEMRSFCKAIRSTPKGEHLCLLSDRALCMECGETGKAVSRYCHAGLIDTAIPIKFNDTILGFMMFGQIADKPSSEIIPALKRLGENLNMDYKYLHSLYDELGAHDAEKIDSIANILKMATRYLWLSEYIKIGYDTTASKIDEYIRSHLSEELTVKVLCEAFGISKNRLYEISHEWFHCSIGEYIAKTRVEEAKALLSTTDFPINQICAKVGIKDYNYFTKFFKSYVGTPPLKYRKSLRNGL